MFVALYSRSDDHGGHGQRMGCYPAFPMSFSNGTKWVFNERCAHRGLLYHEVVEATI